MGSLLLSSCKGRQTLPPPVLGFQLRPVTKRQVNKFIYMYSTLQVGETSVKSNSSWWLRTAYLASATKNNTFVEKRGDKGRLFWEPRASHGRLLIWEGTNGTRLFADSSGAISGLRVLSPVKEEFTSCF